MTLSETGQTTEMRQFPSLTVAASGFFVSPSSYLKWTRGTGGPGALQTGLLLSWLRSRRAHALHGRTPSLGLGFAVGAQSQGDRKQTAGAQDKK